MRISKLKSTENVNLGQSLLRAVGAVYPYVSIGERKMTNFLTQYHDIQGVMAANDSMALGVVKALDSAGKSGTIKVVGFDNIPAVQPLIKGGKMLATVEQYGAQMAALGIDYGLRQLAGEKFTGWVKTDVKLITVADL